MKRVLVLVFLLGLAAAAHTANVTSNLTIVESAVNKTVNFTVFNQGPDALNRTQLFNYTTGPDHFNITSVDAWWWNESRGANNTAWGCSIADGDGDGRGDAVDCALGDWLYHNLTAGDYLNITLTMTAFESGNVTWNLTTWDNATDVNYNATYVVVDLKRPSVSASLNQTVVTNGSQVTVHALATNADDDVQGVKAFVPFDYAVTTTAIYGQSYTAAGDLNGDGAEELVYADTSQGTTVTGYKIHIMDFANDHDYDTGLRGNYVNVGDIDGDGLDEIVYSNVSDDHQHYIISVFDNSTNATYALDAAVDSQVMELCDVNGDGAEEIVFENDTDEFQMIFDSMTGYMHNTSVYRSSLSCGDVDGDGAGELVYYEYTTKYLHIYDNQTQEHHNTSIYTSTKLSRCADTDGDGKAEVTFPRWGASDYGGYIYDNQTGTLASMPTPENWSGLSGSFYGGTGEEFMIRDDDLGTIHLYDPLVNRTLLLNFTDKYNFSPVDVDGDGADELTFRDNGGYYLKILSFNPAIMADDGSAPDNSADDDNYTALYTVGELSEGNHTIIILANNSAGLYNSSEWVNITVDRSAPTIENIIINDTVLAPGNWVEIHAVLSDVAGIQNFTIDWTPLGLTLLNFTDHDGDGNWTFIYEVPSVPSDAYALELNATDIFGYNNSSNVSLTVDSVQPNVTGVSPSVNATTSNTRPVFYANVSDDLSGAVMCNVTRYINNTPMTTLEIEMEDDRCLYAFDTDIPNNTAVNVTFIVQDAAGNWNTTETWSGTYLVETNVTRGESIAFRGYANPPFPQAGTANLRNTLTLTNTKNVNTGFGKVAVQIDNNSTNTFVSFSNGTVVDHEKLDYDYNDTVIFEVGNLDASETRTYFIDYNSTSLRYANGTDGKYGEIVLNEKIKWTRNVTVINGLKLGDTIQGVFPVPPDATNVRIYNWTRCDDCVNTSVQGEYAKQVFYIAPGGSRIFNITYELPAPVLHEEKTYASTKNDTTVFWFERLKLENKASKNITGVSVMFQAPSVNLTAYNLTNSSYWPVGYEHASYVSSPVVTWLNWTESGDLSANSNHTYYLRVNTAKLNVTNFKWTPSINSEKNYPLNLSAYLQSYETETFEFVPEILGKGTKTKRTVSLVPYTNTTVASVYNMTVTDHAGSYTLRYNLTSLDGVAYSGTQAITLEETPIVPITLNDTTLQIGEWSAIDFGYFNNTETTATTTYHFEVLGNDSAIVNKSLYPVVWGVTPINLASGTYADLNRFKVNNTTPPGSYSVHASLTSGSTDNPISRSGQEINSSVTVNVPVNATMSVDNSDISSTGTKTRAVINIGNVNLTVEVGTRGLTGLSVETTNGTVVGVNTGFDLRIIVPDPPAGGTGYVDVYSYYDGDLIQTDTIGITLEAHDTSGTTPSGSTPRSPGSSTTTPVDDEEEEQTETEQDLDEVLDEIDLIQGLDIPIEIDQDLIDEINDLIEEAKAEGDQSKFNEAQELIDELRESVGTARVVDSYDPRMLGEDELAKNLTRTLSGEDDLETINDNVIYSVDARIVAWTVGASTKYYTTVTMSAKLRESREHAYLVVNLPKDLAQSTDDVRFIDNPIILEEDPVFAYQLDTLGGTFSYQLAEDLDQSSINTITTTSIAKRIARCGDGICEEENCCDDCGCDEGEECNKATHLCEEIVETEPVVEAAEGGGMSLLTILGILFVLGAAAGGGYYVYSKKSGGMNIKKLLDSPDEYPVAYLSGQLKTIDENNGYLTDSSGSVKVYSEMPIYDQFCMVKGRLENGVLLAESVIPVEMKSQFASKHVGDSAQTPEVTSPETGGDMTSRNNHT